MHHYKVRELILRLARERGQVLYKGLCIPFYPDVSAEVANRRAAFNQVKAELRGAGIEFGVLFPARLRINTEQIEQEIKRVLPELDVNKLQDVVSHLCIVVGVQKTQDLALVEVTDLQDFLFPIQCRKLLMDFKQREHS
ncbi:unnamed protein product [Leuciscus chuanchicus]